MWNTFCSNGTLVECGQQEKKPIKQKLRQFRTKKKQAIQEEVTKLLQAEHITKIRYPKWLSNIIVVPKNGGKWRIYIDFNDLKKVCPKNCYPLPKIDELVDATIGSELLSIIDAYQGYN